MTKDTGIYTLHQGATPLLISLPHVGRQLPDDLASRCVERALAVEDTDWHLDELYAFARDMGAGMLVPRFSRYVVDLNRPPDNAPMYAGANNTGLCPTCFFTGDPLYREGQGLRAGEVAERVDTYWRPYHDEIANELGRLASIHGHAVLFEGHSIKSELPWLFEGTLPALNLGTVDGNSCAASMRAALVNVLDSQEHFSHVVDGRFKGGYITRRYGRPEQGVHAVQLEKCWRTYMREEPPYELDAERVARLEPVLRSMIRSMIDWRPA
jgi:N-formylglutamate deformylase